MGDHVPSTTPEPTPAKPNTQPKPTPSVASIDPDGDLILHVGETLSSTNNQARSYRVCSATMRRSSPVWKSMLFGPWAEAKPDHGDWIVELPVDNSGTLKVLLSIIHGKFGEVPKDVSLALLYDIVVLADKYDIIHALRPWVDSWVQAVKNPAPGCLYTGYGHITRTHAAWELGCEDVVAEEMIDFIFNLACRGGTTFSYGFMPVFFGARHGPPDLMEVVTSLRTSLVQTILDFYHAEVESRIPGNSACCQPGYYSTNRSLCDSVILGGMWRHLQSKKQDFPPKKAADYHQSANDLLLSLSAMFRDLHPFSNHNECLPSKKFSEFETKTRADERWKNVLQPHHKKRLAEQRAKTGLTGP